MLTDYQEAVIDHRLHAIKYNKRRLAKLQTILRGNARECNRVEDDFADAAAMCIEAPRLMKAVMPVSKSPVWRSVSHFLCQELPKHTKKMKALNRASSKASTKARRTFGTCLQVAVAIKGDSDDIRAALLGEPV